MKLNKLCENCKNNCKQPETVKLGYPGRKQECKQRIEKDTK